jgi:hypothetical protein
VSSGILDRPATVKCGESRQRKHREDTEARIHREGRQREHREDTEDTEARIHGEETGRGSRESTGRTRSSAEW